MKACVSSESVIINDSALPKSVIVLKDISLESGVDAIVLLGRNLHS